MKAMPGHNRSIGGAGLEQGGPNLGNDYSRDMTREVTSDDNDTPVVPHNEQPGNSKAYDRKKKNQQQGPANNKEQQDQPGES